jgi:hypothetical protein
MGVMRDYLTILLADRPVNLILLESSQGVHHTILVLPRIPTKVDGTQKSYILYWGPIWAQIGRYPFAGAEQPRLQACRIEIVLA